MIQILLSIWEFVKKLKTIVITIWFAIHGVLRFVFRMAQAVPFFLSNLPVWIAPVALICLCVGFGFLILGRR